MESEQKLRPVPPNSLRHLVAGTDNEDWFLSSGKLAVKSLENISDFKSYKTILDFGCGCGRVLRHITDTDAELHGADYNSKLIEWDKNNLNGIQFSVNNLTPPLRYESEKFDLVYCFSVFTHLSEQTQLLWLSELHRIIKPNGHFIFSVSGEPMMQSQRKALTEQEISLFNQDNLIVRGKDIEGENDCAVFHPIGYVVKIMKGKFEILRFISGGALGCPPQDLYLVKKI